MLTNLTVPLLGLVDTAVLGHLHSPEYLGAVAVGADTWGLDAIPPMAGNDVFPCHAILLAQHGVYILENMDTRELAADGATEFFFTVGAGKISGAVQMIVNPVAIR